MYFYFIRVLFPAVVIDVWLTFELLKRNKKSVAAFVPPPFYLLTAYFWMHYLGADGSFSGQGAIGLGIFLGIGILLFVFRLLVGLFIMTNPTK